MLKMLLSRSHRNERRSFLPLSALAAFLPVRSAVLTFSLFSTLALVLNDLWPTCGSFDATGSNEKCVVDFSALLAERGEGGGSKEKEDSVVDTPIGGAVWGYRIEYFRALRLCWSATWRKVITKHPINHRSSRRLIGINKSPDMRCNQGRRLVLIPQSGDTPHLTRSHLVPMSIILVATQQRRN